MSDQKHIPQVGDPIGVRDVEEIVEAIVSRQQKFPGEPVGLTIALILMNIGDRYSPVECIEQEWTALKKDIPKGEGVPKCPNGHVLTQGPGLKLGWLQDI